MKKFKLIVIITIITAIIAPVTYMLITEKMLIRLPALVQENPRITFVMGKAYFRKSPEDKWTHAIVGTELYTSYEVKTEAHSIMDIRFHSTMAIRVVEKSILKIDDISVKKIYLNVQKGSMYGTFEKIFKNHSLKIKTPTALAAVRGTELGFEVIEIKEDKKDEKEKKGTDKDKNVNKSDKDKPANFTRVYALSGITEISNRKDKDQKILLSYQKKLDVSENGIAKNPEQMKEKEISKLRSILNSIHKEEVLLISDKINFTPGSAKITPSSFDELNKIVLLLKKRKIKIRIEGHADSQGGAAYSQKLSVQRAESIQNYFIKMGIEKERLSIAGFGLSKPVASNATAKGRAMNRRVEFIIVKKESILDTLMFWK